MDSVNISSVSNRSAHPPEWRSNRSSGAITGKFERLETEKMGHLLIDLSTTRGATSTRTEPFHSASRIGLLIRWNDVLIVVGGASSPVENEPMISEWGIHFYQLLDNQERYREMDAASPLSSSNRSIHPLTWSSDRSLEAHRRRLK